MKGDFTRETFDRAAHVKAVRMQQGRVQLDADWNEAGDVDEHLRTAFAAGLLGGSGTQDAPADGGEGFLIRDAAGTLTVDAGRFYVDGVLCENEATVPLDGQPELPGAVHPSGPDTLLVYLDSWDRHLTAVELPAIREVALGGPDTATRVRSTWQVRWHGVAAGSTCSGTEIADPAFPPSDALLAAIARTDDVGETCGVKPGAQYTRLENHLYRVEVHTPGTLETAGFVWSRDNGMVVAGLAGIEPGAGTTDTITVGDVGRDTFYGFASGCIVEILDDRRELSFAPGDLRQVERVEGDRLIVTVPGGVHLAAADYGAGARVRRWDGVLAPFAPDADGFMPLEDGVRVALTGTRFNAGDYWVIPARTNEGDVEWPQSAPGVPAPQPPRGILHRRAKLGIATPAGAGWAVQDCRPLFPSLTAMEQLFYVGGDGQSVTPNLSAPAALLPLPERPTVGVSRGKLPVSGARVRFAVTSGVGVVTGAAPDGTLTVLTDGDGLAACEWFVDSVLAHQTLEARLVDDGGAVEHLPLRFNASLELASLVAYQPGACPDLAGAATVQDALDILCARPSGGGEGCCTKVANDEELKEALSDPRADDEGLCICLEPGQYTWPDGLMLEGRPRTVSISGRPRATTIRFASPVHVAKVVALALHDLDLTGDGIDAIFDCEGVSLVRIEGCRVGLANAQPRATALRFARCSRVFVERSEVSCVLEAEKGFVPPKQLLPPDLAAILQAIGRAGIAAGNQVATRLAGQSPAQRQALSAATKEALQRQERNLSTDEQAAIRRITQQLDAPAANSGVIIESAAQLQAQLDQRAVRANGAAVTLFDGSGDVWLNDNLLNGALILYGAPPVPPGNPVGGLADLAKLVQSSLSQGTTAPGELVLSGNQLDRIGACEPAELRANTPTRLFSRIRADGNSFATFPNELYAECVVLTGNIFTLAGTNLSGCIGAVSSSMTGNAAERQTNIAIVADVRAESGNARVAQV